MTGLPSARETFRDLAALLVEEYGFGPRLELDRAAKGHSNLNVVVRLEGRDLFVLRSPVPGRHGQFVREIRLMDWLSCSRSWTRTPRVVRPRSRRGLCVRRGGRIFALLERLPGTSAKPPSPRAPPPLDALEAVGSAVAELHRILQEWPQGNGLPFSYESSMPRLFHEAGALLRNRHREQDTGTRSMLDECAEWMPSVITRCDEAWEDRGAWGAGGVVHGDIRFANLLFVPPFRLVGVLDYESVGWAPIVVEHAVAARNLLTVEAGSSGDLGTVRRDGLRAYVSGYEKSRESPLTVAERRQIEAFFPIATLQELHFLVRRGPGMISPKKRRHLIAVAISQLFAYGFEGRRLFDP